MQPSNTSKLDVPVGATTRRKSGPWRGGAQGHAVHALPPHLVIQRVLGEGGTSIVYQALHTRLKVPVAVKVLAQLEHHQEEAAERLLREAELCARLTDPRFPRIYDVDQLEDGTPFMVMEHISGRTLAELVAAGPFEVEAAWAIAREVLEALMDIHDLGVIHRDIKPANILIESPEGREQRVRIVDFGIAKHTRISAPVEPLTEQGAMVGTPHYMAPEQMRGARLDVRVDLYAVGAVLYEMLAGRPAFDGVTVGDVIAATLRDDPAPLSSLRDDVPEPLEAFVKKAMARDRRERFATAHEMLCALQATRISIPPVRPFLGDASFPPEASGTRAVTRAPVRAEEPPKASLVIMPEPLEAGPRVSSPLDTGAIKRPRRASGAIKLAVVAVAASVPFWPTRLGDARAPVPVVTAVDEARRAPEVEAAPAATSAPASSPMSMPSTPLPIVIESRSQDADEAAEKRSRRRSGRPRAEPQREVVPAAEEAPSEAVSAQHLRVRTPESLPERSGSLPQNPY